MRNGERVQLVPKTKDPKALVEATRRISATLTPMVCSLPDCLRNPCKNNATCVETLSGYTCTCAPYTSGTNCETGTACMSNPCTNNATCVETLPGYTCTCAPYFSGTHCETGTACLSNPCTNNATCVETLPGYTCTCAPYFSGTHCETVTACLSNPCMNSATCVETLPGYACTCAPYYTGRHCETDDCPPNWTLGDGKCYLFISPYSSSWQDAKDYCANLNGVVYGNALRYPSLLYIDDAAEHRAFNAIVPGGITHWWLNCNDIAQEGVWTCERDRNGTPGSYRNWINGEPNSGLNYDCAYGLLGATPPGEWADHQCTMTNHIYAVCRITVD